MGWQEYTVWDAPADDFMEDRLGELQVQTTNIFSKRFEIWAHASAGEYEEGLKKSTDALASASEAIDLLQAMLFRMFSVYPWGSNELAARVLERFNANGDLDIPVPPPVGS